MKRRKGNVEASATQLTELEALRWGKMDAEMRNVLQGVRLTELELESLHRGYLDQKREKELSKRQLEAKAASLKEEYLKYTTGLAEKYKVDPQRMTIDPDTGVIREV